MGIPKFFRWMSTKYPGLHVVARPGQLPEVDNFYLDMNGIIHNCTHPCDGDVHFRLTEAEMFEDIFNYIEQLFRIIKPRKVFFMAVDGVAPRAKMNQQRGRRFRSAKEASDREEAAIKKGDILPSEKRFDSNCITPGTEFMVNLNKALNEFIIQKLTNDREWQRVKVILSGHETPGEGEHKVMDYIRYQRSQPGYDIRTRHCLYGLDTDLIMLGLSSHEPNFLLLREEIKLNRKSNDSKKPRSGRVDPSKIEFNVLYLDRLREHLEQDFRQLERKLRFRFDLESIIDDWILICFLVGNDFIPHIPHFHIHKDALPTIFGVYQEILPKLDGYINENGILNFKRFRVLAKALAKVDFENYQTLLKENGGECAKNDFTKLNMFIKHKLKISGIDGGHRYHRSSYNKSDRTSTHHSHFHQTNDWYKLQSKSGGRHSTGMNGGGHGKFNHIEKRGLHSSSNHHQSPQNQSSHHQTRQQHGYPMTNGHSRPSNGTTNGNNSKGVGVHSFTEEQINNSITLCADGDFLDLSDEEFLSDEKFPGEPARKSNQPGRKSANNHQQNNVSIMSRGDSAKKNGGKIDGKIPKLKPKVEDYDDFVEYKKTYYKEKLDIDPTPENIGKVVQEYVRALQWNLHYYYHGCKSWGWFYPYHYAPFISDVMNFRDVDTEFEMGEPFKPFDQLLSVLPAASSTLLPKMYRTLVTSTSSPLAKYFPTEVEYDLNGKQNDWEAVVLAPFIDEAELLKASVLYNLFLSEHERQVNQHGPHLMFYYEYPRYAKPKNPKDRNGGSTSASPGLVKCVQIDKNGFLLPIDKIKFGLLPPDDQPRNETKARDGQPNEIKVRNEPRNEIKVRNEPRNEIRDRNEIRNETRDRNEYRYEPKDRKEPRYESKPNNNNNRAWKEGRKYIQARN